MEIGTRMGKNESRMTQLARFKLTPAKAIACRPC